MVECFLPSFLFAKNKGDGEVKKERISGVYHIKNLVNGKVYIGSSIDINKRWKEHINSLRIFKHHSYKLQRAWDKHGEDNFSFEIIEIFNGDIAELRKLEQYYLDLYNASDFSFGYNVSSNTFGRGAQPSTYEDIINGKLMISKEQFDQVIHYLCNSRISIPEISKITGVQYRSIYQIYYKENYKNIVKDMNFIHRTISGEDNHNNKLTEDWVIEIISMLLNKNYMIDIARKYKISTNIICDIYYHRTWKEYTKDIVFPEYEKAYNTPTKPISQYDLEGNFIASFESAREAERVTGIGYKMISRVCKGERPYTHGFIWKFAS